MPHESSSIQGTACERCGAAMPAKFTAFVHEGQVVCRECHDQLDPRCPTCGEPLAEPVQATRPCPECGWPIYLAREQDVFDTTLLNKDQHEQLNALRKKLGPLRRFGITEGKYVRTRARLKRYTGDDPDEITVMRRLYYRAYQNCKTPADRATVAYAEARFLYEHGQDYAPVLRKAHRRILEAFEQRGCEQVSIVGPDTCAYCKKRADVALPLQQEIDRPELPYADCPNRVVGTEMIVEGERHRLGVHKNAFCEATYQPK